MFKIAEIITDNNSRELDRFFEYIIPESLIKIICIGMKVIIPFGKGNKLIEGYVINIKDKSEYDYNKLKSIIDISSSQIKLNEELIRLSFYIKEKYNCTLFDAFRTITPPGTISKENISLRLKENSTLNIPEKYMSIIQLLNDKNYILFQDIKKVNKGITRALIFEMEQYGFIEIMHTMKQRVNIKTKDVFYIKDLNKCKEFINKFGKKCPKQVEILKHITEFNEEQSLADIYKKLDCSQSVVKELEKKNLIYRKTIELTRDPIKKEFTYNRFNLTNDQKEAISKILNQYQNGKNSFLLHGVTGCGKTEIYLNLAERFIDNNYGVIILVPEISLTPQTVERFKGRLGNTVAVLHSRLSEGEKYDEWRKINSGKVKIVIGARSAVFAPIKSLKLIIIDEEHEYTYKSEVTPKYVTKEIAQYRINENNGLLVLGSATPSIDTYYDALNGKYSLVEINKRVGNIPLPQIITIDMRDELSNGNRSIFSKLLYSGIENTLLDKKQTILFLNRRGHSTFISCRKCGYVCKCTNCDVALTYHKNSSKLICHYCGFEYPIPNECPKCKSKYIKYFGVGTERIEYEVNKLFPTARVLRMDMDTTTKKGTHEEIYNKFKNNEADILIGTQMISKGMDFKNVSLVGMIAADMSLNMPDFRSAERTFQLITQVAGRSGRSHEQGKVIVQTYDPSHYSIKFACAQDYKGFYNQEIKFRKLLNQPPFSDIIYVLFTSENEKELQHHCSDLASNFKEIKCEILGPTPCSILKIKNKYRWHMIFKGDVYTSYKIIDNIICDRLKDSKVNYNIDINPYNMF